MILYKKYIWNILQKIIISHDGCCDAGRREIGQIRKNGGSVRKKKFGALENIKYCKKSKW